MTAEQAETSWLGVALTASSLAGIPILGTAKRRLADQLGSVATREEGTQNFSVPTSPAPSSSASSETRSSDSGGSTLPPLS